MKILICEDVPSLTLDLWLLLHSQGHAVCGIARSTTACLEKARASRPDLVIVDEATQGDLSGISLVEALTVAGFPTVLLSDDPQALGSGSSAKAVLGLPLTEAGLASVMEQVRRQVERAVAAA